MNKFLLAAVAAAVVASPAMARDGSPYVGIEAGLLKAKDSDFDRRGPLVNTTDWVNWLKVDHKLGYDVDFIAGYDFGLIRLEGELGRKRARHDEYAIDANAPGPFPAGVSRGGTYSADGRTSVTSAMINALVDFGNEDGLSFYAGGGVGLARVSSTIDRLGDSKYHLRDRDVAWQIIAGARQAVSDNVDFGIKYRYFSAGTLKGGLYSQPFDARSFVHSHSLLASVMYNFGARVEPVVVAPPPPPPAPEPVAPATQTCADGSVILATDACPAPPVEMAPPPPPPAPERG
jgi:opacity protein-like surface antigen